ncbi:hypothetical protein Purlil1_11027 [Purpureocillium lilacinum]|uniref:Uncharacterized protein n=1 Tax=Purpureocillium lilacinum TaxID=33203 RepID=A0ABR0BL47_PURLI|nr:hypothetical protein Purlil1_11027 [Purpureocillium lilacinum]
MPFRRTLLVRPGGRWSSGGAACFGSGDDTTRPDPTLWRLQSCDGEHRLRSGSEAKRAVARGPKRDRTTTKHDRRGGRGDWGEWDEESRDRTGQTGDKRDETRHDETRTHARTHARGLARQVQSEWVLLQDNAGAEKRGGRWRGWAAARAASSSMQGVVAVVQASCFRSEAHGEEERESGGRGGGGGDSEVEVDSEATREDGGEGGTCNAEVKMCELQVPFPCLPSWHLQFLMPRVRRRAGVLAGWLQPPPLTRPPASIFRRRRPLKSRPQKRALKATTAHTQEATNLRRRRV